MLSFFPPTVPDGWGIHSRLSLSCLSSLSNLLTERASSSLFLPPFGVPWLPLPLLLFCHIPFLPNSCLPRDGERVLMWKAPMLGPMKRVLSLWGRSGHSWTQGQPPPNTSPQQDPPLFWTQCSEFQGGLKKGYGWWIGFLVSSLGSQTEFSRWSGVEWGRSAVISSARFVPCLQDIFRAKLHGSELMRGSTEQRLQSDGWLVDL